MSNSLTDIKNSFSKNAFGLSLNEALCNRMCVSCKHYIRINSHATCDEKKIPGTIYSRNGLKEFTISGLCEACFDKMMTSEE